MNKTLKAILTFVGVTPACAAVSSLLTSLQAVRPMTAP